MDKYTYTEISGILVKITHSQDPTLALKRHSQKRPAARYNRPGQDALYLSIDETSARVAMAKYINAIDHPLVLVEFEIEPCQLVDLRHENAKELRALTSQDWRAEIEAGHEPMSWKVSDELRAGNEIGLIDPSRKKPKIWHITLFRWNEAGAPKVRMIGVPKTISTTST